MGASAEFVAFVCELLEPLGGGLSSGPFFGGLELRYHGRRLELSARLRTKAPASSI